MRYRVVDWFNECPPGLLVGDYRSAHLVLEFARYEGVKVGDS